MSGCSACRSWSSSAAGRAGELVTLDLVAVVSAQVPQHERRLGVLGDHLAVGGVAVQQGHSAGDSGPGQRTRPKRTCVVQIHSFITRAPVCGAAYMFPFPA